MLIREYLVREAERLTGRFRRTWPAPSAWDEWVSARRAQFHEMLGIDTYLAATRTPLRVHTERVITRPGFRIEVLRYESLPGLYVAANLYVPDTDRPAPGIVYVCGHSDDQKVHYQSHPRRLAQLGFVTLIVDTIQLGEVRGIHHGIYRYGCFHWISRAYSPAGVEVWNAIRGLDLLSERAEVDPARLGITGTSGGGAISWWTAAADERIRAVAPSCGTATTASHIRERTIDGHCDCMFPANLYGWSLLEMSALVAPRPLLIASAARDSIFTEEGIRAFHEELAALYSHLSHPDHIELVTFDGPHSYHPRTRTAIFSWFARHLQGREIAPEAIGDIGEEREEARTLAVFSAGPPPNDASTAVQDWFIRRPAPPEITDAEALTSYRAQLCDRLRQTAFQAFPAAPPPLEVKVHHRWADGGGAEGARFSYQSEEGWRLVGELRRPAAASVPAPTAVALQPPGERREGGL
ncbi:MAG TPA: hypothetical protein VF234_04915, partial [Limnochordia bacterium]